MRRTCNRSQGRHVASRYDECPHCGNPVDDGEHPELEEDKSSRNSENAVFLFLLIAAAGIGGIAYTASGPDWDSGRQSYSAQSSSSVQNTDTRWTTTAVNMRGGPSTNHRVVTQLEEREEITILPDSGTGDWAAHYSSQTDSVIGYVSRQYLSEAYPGNFDTDTDLTLSYERPEQSDWDSSVRTVEQYLERNLNDPSSYESVEWYKMIRTEYDSQEVWAVRHTFRANNRLGALVLKDKVFYMEAKGEVVGVRNYRK